MKLTFDPNLDYQLQAIEAVCDLFRGQEVCRTEFTVTRPGPAQQMTDLGVGNRLMLADDQLLQNLREVQLRGGLAPADELVSSDFTVEMETGTGKTYVYLRTLFELNKRYGFSKFVIVVPSVAIKEGVYKSLQITEQHFRSLYAGTPVEFFLYDTASLGQVRNFATSPDIQVMVVTVGAINKKDINNLYKESEKTGGEKPVDLISATRPILIVDEPQSVDGGLKGAGKTALQAMNPLCTLRYSATHTDQHHMLYRLDALDAYERKLVKQIEVAAATVEGAHNQAFLRLVSVSARRGQVSACVELDVDTTNGVKRQQLVVSAGDDLQQLTGRDIYAGCRVGEISTAAGQERLELHHPGGDAALGKGQAWGDADALAVQREMIRRTIHEHLDKEKRLRPKGIKVLSLFFIDAVERYRTYDAQGNAMQGDYARIFEEEYRRASQLPAYRSLFAEIGEGHAAEQVHNGYFSRDRQGRWLDTAENNAGNRENAERAYSLIMKEKEKLLSFATPLKFIFSHSALKEGWDNPNVFQICTLREMGSERDRRQTIGRGLRLCVNQQGERVRDVEINRLTIIASESYEQFAANLQKEIEADTGIRFGILQPHQFAAIARQAADGTLTPLGMAQSSALWEHLQATGYIDAAGRVQDALKRAMQDGTLALPAAFDALGEQIGEVLRKACGRLAVKNADQCRTQTLRTEQGGKRAPLSADFKALWERITHQTSYRVQFDNARLVDDCITALQAAPAIARARLQWRKADIAVGRAGIQATTTEPDASTVLEEADIELPDLLTELQDRTQLTRRSILAILTGCGRLDDFKRNPQRFIEHTAEIINRRKRLALGDGIRYQKIGDGHGYAQELFARQELTGYLHSRLPEPRNPSPGHPASNVELQRRFAEAVETRHGVLLYTELPGGFTVPTPLGLCNPSWAVLLEQDGAERLYLVV